MSPELNGIHHITAMCGDPQRNVNFYVHGLGQRLLKKTVNFDDPSTYHFYYGDRMGSLGTVLTFFPWPNVPPGVRGNREIAAFAYSAPRESQEFWEARLADYGARQAETEMRFGETVLPFQDPDGMWFELVLTDDLGFAGDESSDVKAPDPETIAPETLAAENSSIPREMRLGPFSGASLWVESMAPTVDFLESVFGWTVIQREPARTRVAGGDPAHSIDVIARPGAHSGRLGPGSIHHIAFRAKDMDEQDAWKKRILAAGIPVTKVADRHYFQSIYFREPGGVLCEIATEGPGFAVDETADKRGEVVQLPPWLESRRGEIIAQLPTIEL